jgi:phospholipid/cholesterol/gamma-HCH transport system ATP-binding protein
VTEDTQIPSRAGVDSDQAVGLVVDGLFKDFGEQTVLNDINLEIEPGEVFVIMGPSGSGKSVLLKHMIGLEHPTRGEVSIDGKPVTDPATLVEVKATLVFQAGALFNSMSVFDNLALYPTEHRLYDKKTIRDKVMDTLRILSLENAVQKYPSELSGGMRKRVSIARALVMEPQLILYDEPTSELDPIMAATITELIASLRHQTHITSVVVSHDRDLSMTIADRVALMLEGKIHLVDTPANFQKSTDPRVTEFMNPRIDLANPRYKAME